MYEPLISRDEMLKRVAELNAPTPTGGGVLPRPHKHYRPLSSAVPSLVRQAQSTERLFLGIPEIDSEMRGITPGAMCMLIGYSHNGKTLVEIHAIRHNRDKRILMFMPDEPTTLLLTKLTCVQHGIDARTFEARVAANDQEAIDLLHKTAEVEFPNLVHIDAALDGRGIVEAYDEACEAWGAKPDLVLFDYLELFPVGETVKSQADWVKSFGMANDVPILVVHQTSRSAGADGKAMSISSGAYGGETHATFLLGVRRKKFAIQAELRELRPKVHSSERIKERVEELEYDLEIHNFTITVNMDKNKRPGGRTVDEFDMELDIDNGRLYPLPPGDLPAQYLRRYSNDGGW